MRRTLIASLAVSLALPVWAETTQTQATDHSAHAGHTMSGMETEATRQFMEANARMHADMNVPFTGNADVDFIAGMIPHHQGAVEMARIVLEHGTDPEVRKLAEAIIAAQETEIAWMQDWLARNGGSAGN